MCPQWSRSGYCHKESQFMYFHCRESCGSCGFKSRMSILNCVIIIERIIYNKMLKKKIPFFPALNTENQIEDGKQYTDLSSRSDFSKFFLSEKSS